MSDDSATVDFKAKFARLLELRQEADRTKVAAEKAKKAYKAYEAELYIETEDAKMEGRWGWDFGPELGTAKFNRRSTIYGRVLDKDTAVAALKAEGLLDTLIADAVAEGRLNELVRDRLEAGQSLPDGIDFYSRDVLAISRK